MAIVDTGVDATRRRSGAGSRPGSDVLTNGVGNDDTPHRRIGGGRRGTTRSRPSQRPRHPAGRRDRPVRAPGDPQPGQRLRPLPEAPAATDGRDPGRPTPSPPTRLYDGLDFVAENPFVRDPVRPNKLDRVVAADMGFGTTETFDTEGRPSDATAGGHRLQEPVQAVPRAGDLADRRGRPVRQPRRRVT